MAIDVTERNLAVLYVSIMGLTRCYKTTVFLKNIYSTTWLYVTEMSSCLDDHKRKKCKFISWQILF